MKQAILITGASNGFGALAAIALSGRGTSSTRACGTPRGATRRR
jgi:NADP-dependent 3-hydroxy acid dehydrogenase YdfG